MNTKNNVFRRTSVRLKNFVTLMRYSFANMNVLKTRRMNQQTKNTLMLINMVLGKMDRLDPLYVQRTAEFNRVMIELTRARWANSLAMQTNERPAWQQATRLCKQAEALANTLHELVASGSPTNLEADPVALDAQGTEILFADGAPLVPSINPIVVLKGSDFEMGEQYARQLVEIFGPWILKRHARPTYPPEQLAALNRWEAQVREHAPEFIPFFYGWVAGAAASGVNLTYENVLDLWVGHERPSASYIGEDGLPELGYPLCSGLAAWGQATVDGKLVTGSSGDHDIGHTVTVVAFPAEGNSYIFAPFGADGGVPNAGPLYFFGHPGMNEKGLAYVHHGGGPKMIEPKEYWGYGLRRTIAVLHVLRYCDNLEQARAMDLAFPVGDSGMGDPATAGGFYADRTGAFIVESKADPVIVREPGLLGETDFIFATNAPMHPDVAAAPWLQVEPDDWEWSAPGGWRPKTFKEFNLGSLENPHLLGMKWSWFSSFQRNRQAYASLASRAGQIDIDAMTEIYRISGTIPEGDWPQVVKAYAEEKWQPAVGNASNALVVFMKPEDGIYRHCVGAAARGLAPMSAKNSSPLYDETNTFWEIRLKGSPAEMISHARDLAESEVRAIAGALESAALPAPMSALMAALTQAAQEALAAGHLHFSQSDDVNTRACALRAFTRAQVRARQVRDFLNEGRGPGSLPTAAA